jgi:hypothetical protein
MHVGGYVKLHAFLISSLLEVNGELQASTALPPRMEPSVSIENEARQASKPV